MEAFVTSVPLTALRRSRVFLNRKVVIYKDNDFILWPVSYTNGFQNANVSGSPTTEMQHKLSSLRRLHYVLKPEEKHVCRQCSGEQGVTRSVV